VYARQSLDPVSLGGLIDLISNIALGETKARSADVLGHVFEYAFYTAVAENESARELMQKDKLRELAVSSPTG
jgi:type I restriction enzyme M protein